MTTEQQYFLTLLEKRIQNVKAWEEIEQAMKKTYEQYGCIPQHLMPKRRGRGRHVFNAR